MLKLILGLWFIVGAPLALAASPGANAQPGVSHRDAVFLLREPRHIEIALETVLEKISPDGTLTLGQTTLVICGKNGIHAVEKKGKLAPLIARARKEKIRVVACGLSLKEAGIEAGSLDENIELVPNGLWEVLRLQAAGALSVEI